MVARVKTWVAAETLTAADLNTEFDNLITSISTATADHIDLTDAYAWTGAHTFSTAPQPSADDSCALGASGTGWADLFLASGSVVNFNAGDVTLTHSANILTVGGGDLHVANGNGVVIGHTAQVAAGITDELQVLGTSAGADSGMMLGCWSTTDTNSAQITFLKSGNATIGSNTIVADNENLGKIRWRVDDGTDYATNAADIEVEVDGTPGTNDCPARMVFRTTADGASSTTEAMRIDSSQNVTIGTGTYAATKTALNIGGGTTADTLTFHLNDTTSSNNQAIGNIDFWGNDAGDGDQVRARLSVQYAGSGGGGEFIFQNWDNSTLAEHFRIDNTGIIFTGGETSHGNVNAGGMVLDQNAGDDFMMVFKSSDVAHGGDGAGETDDFGAIEKIASTGGGLFIRGYADAQASSGQCVLIEGKAADNASTVKTTSATAMLTMQARQLDGAGNNADIVANGNVFVVRALVSSSVVARLLIDEDGDMWSVTAGQTFDSQDDIALINDYDKIRSDHTGWAVENEQRLIELKVLGDTVANGGLTNVTQLQRLHNGALRQLGDKMETMQLQLDEANAKLALLGRN
jgi:hypothetical protein